MNQRNKNKSSKVQVTGDRKGEQEIVTEKNADKKLDQPPREVNGPKGLEPTRYGDWEANGRCYDF